MEEVRFKIKSASEAGASALLIVSGDRAGGTTSSGGGDRGGGGGGSGGKGGGGRRSGGGAFYLDSLSLLREAHSMREAGEIDEDVMLACVANPTAEGGEGREGLARLEAKIEAGAEMVITQPSLIPSRHRAWWESVKRAGLDQETEIVFGAALSTSSKNLGFWMRLTAGSSSTPLVPSFTYDALLIEYPVHNDACHR